MAFAQKMIDIKKQLEKAGHTVYISEFAELFLGKTEKEKIVLNRKNVLENNAIREHWEKIKESDAILVLNYERKGIPGYVGGNTFLEIGFAYILNKTIYLLYPAPNISFYKAEIEGMTPVVLNGDLAKIH